MLSHIELNITEQEHDALIEVQAKLAHGDYPWQGRSITDEFTDWGTAPEQFNMCTIYTKNDGPNGCQTACCIGGWIAVHMGYRNRWDAVDYVNNKMSLPLHYLCFPEPGLMNQIQPRDAVKAIDNFLNTSQPMWNYVLSERRIEDHMLDSTEADAIDRVSESHEQERAMIERRAKAAGYANSPEPALIGHDEKERT